MLIYAFYNYTFNYNENLILRISPLLVIGLFEASYESSILFHWMQWPLNLISRPVDVCFALQCSSSFINWRSKTLRILITPWYALLQFLCVRFPFVITHWQTLKNQSISTEISQINANLKPWGKLEGLYLFSGPCFWTSCLSSLPVTASPLHKNEFRFESMFVSPICL